MDVRTEAAIYAEGTPWTTDDLMREWRGHVEDAAQGIIEEPMQPQEFFARLISGSEF